MLLKYVLRITGVDNDSKDGRNDEDSKDDEYDDGFDNEKNKMISFPAVEQYRTGMMLGDDAFHCNIHTYSPIIP